MFNKISVLTILCLMIKINCTEDAILNKGKDNSNSHHNIPRIAGGTDAQKGQFPWMVSIQATNFEVGYHLCGGSLLTPSWVLTAAHCLDSEKPEWLWVVTGEHDMSIDEGSEQYITVDAFIQHPDYVYWEKPYVNDIGLVHLSSPALINKYTGLAPLTNNPYLDFAALCYEAGWGSTSASGPGSDVLQYTGVSLLDEHICLDAYQSFPDDQICAGNVEGGIGFCVGDNGGPLHCKDGYGTYFLAGVMSWRNGCAQPGLPGVYMSTNYYSEWIFSVISS